MDAVGAWTTRMWILHLTLSALLLTVLVAPVMSDAPAIGVLAAAIVIAALLASLIALDGPSSVVGRPHGPPADERRLRGSFRRQSHPAAPGRPMPRAPGSAAGAVAVH